MSKLAPLRVLLRSATHGRQHIAVLPSLAIDHAIRMKTNPGEGRRKEITSAQTPKYRPRNARDDPGREGRVWR